MQGKYQLATLSWGKGIKGDRIKSKYYTAGTDETARLVTHTPDIHDDVQAMAKVTTHDDTLHSRSQTH